YSISTAQLIQWNPAAKSDCTGLWTNTASTLALKTIISCEVTLPPRLPRTGSPTPTQPGMVNNCERFVLVKSGDTCEKIDKAANITLDNFIKWNTGVGGKAYSLLWANVYVCIGV
ncbi:peptidoglycan-binding lysin subgroup, partial [Naviculisporaceae sp. PSN 640]